MAKLDEKRLSELLEKFLPRDEVEAAAKQTRAVVRRRKLDITTFVWTLVLGFAASAEHRTLASLRRAYEGATGDLIEESSFYDRFNDGLVALVKWCAQRAIERAQDSERRLTGVLERFKDLVITDSTVIRLHSMLRNLYPGARTNHSPAALKIHAVLSAVAQGAASIRITPGSAADVRLLKVGKWVAGKLLLFDLGYFSYHLFQRIAQNGGYFISRLKENADPTVVGLNLKHRGRQHPIVGRRLRSVLARLKRDVIDIQAFVEFKKRAYKGIRRKAQGEFRVIGIRNASTGQYHLYVTNVPAEWLSAEECAEVYRLRWEIELFFKEAKTHYRLDEVATRNDAVVLALLYAAVMTTVLSRALQRAVVDALPKRQRRVPMRRFAAVLSTLALQLLHLAAGSSTDNRSAINRALRTLLGEATDPNVSRKPVMATLETRKAA